VWHIRVKNLRCVKATKLKSEITLLFLSSFRDIYDQINDFLKFVGVKLAFGSMNFFLDQGIGFDKSKTFQYFCRVTVLGGLWALRWAWHGKLFLGQSIGIVESIGIVDDIFSYNFLSSIYTVNVRTDDSKRKNIIQNKANAEVEYRDYQLPITQPIDQREIRYASSKWRL